MNILMSISSSTPHSCLQVSTTICTHHYTKYRTTQYWPVEGGLRTLICLIKGKISNYLPNHSEAFLVNVKYIS